MMVVTGYVSVGGNNWVYYHNPLPVGAGSTEFKSYTDLGEWLGLFALG